MRYCVLGPLEIAGCPEIGSRQERKILSLLLLRRGQTATFDQLIEALWGDKVPATAANSLQSKISRLRRSVPHIRSLPNGYSLVTEDDEVDADTFEQLCGEASFAEPDRAVELLERALTLWRGQPFPELEEDDIARGPIARLEGLRVAAQERLVRALLEGGRYARAAAESERFLRSDPFNDGLWEALMRALALDGRRVQAVRTFQQYRAVLADEVGLEPSPALVLLERDIISGNIRARAPETVINVRTHVPMSGREPVLSELCGYVTSALGGQARVLVVTAETGMGKTRLVHEMLSRVAHTGAVVGLGSFTADGSLPLRALDHACAPLMAKGTRLLDNLLSSPTDQRQRAELPVADAIDSMLERAPVGPSIVVIEDLHWADRTSVSLVCSLAAELSRRAHLGVHYPLAVVVTTRPGSSGHKVALARLERESCVALLDIRRLDELALLQLISDAIGRRPTTAFVRRLRDITDGNPLLTLATLRRASAAGELGIVEGRVDVIGSLNIALPGDLEDALARLIDVVPAITARMLERCACVGRTAELALLAAIERSTVEEVRNVLAPAEQLGIVAVEITDAVFHHDLYRRVLLERMDPADTEHTNRAIAEALALEDEPNDSTVVRIARHLVRSASLVDHRRLMHVAERAADITLANASWAEAARLYDVALDARQHLVGAVERGELLLRCGLAHFRNHDAPQAIDRLERAIRVARADRDLRTEGAALLIRQRIALTIDDRLPVVREDLYHDFLDAAGDAAPELRAEIYAQMAEYAFACRRHSDGERWAAEASRLGGALKSPSLRTMTALGEGVSHLGTLNLSEAARCFDNAWQGGDPGDSWHRCAVAARQAIVELIGDGDKVESWLRVSIELGERSQNWSELSFASAVATTRHVIVDDPASAIVTGQQSLAYYARSSYAYTPDVVFPALIAAHVCLGNATQAAVELERWEKGRGRASPVYRLLLAVQTGDVDVVNREVALRPLTSLLGGELDLVRMIRPAVAALAAIKLQETSVLEACLPHLDDMTRRGVVRTLGWPLNIVEIAKKTRSSLSVEGKLTLP